MRHFMSFLIVFLLASMSVYAGEYYYCSFGQQISAEPSDSLVTIVPEERYRPDTKDALEIDHPALDQDYDLVQVGTMPESIILPRAGTSIQHLILFKAIRESRLPIQCLVFLTVHLSFLPMSSS